MPHRYEIKYLISTTRMDGMRRMIAPFVRHDPFTEVAGTSEYCVRSIYLDTPSLRDYHEKNSGLLVRKKVRIRAYNEDVNESLIFLEIKRKNNGTIRKERAPVEYRQLSDLLETGDIHRHIRSNGAFPCAVEHAHHFLYCLHREKRHPVLLVTYEREAYEGLFDPSFRLTFDKNLRVAHHHSTLGIYREDGLRPVFPGLFVMEVKFQISIPVWFTSLVGREQLARRAVSKYCLGLESIKAGNGRMASVKIPSASPVGRL